MDAVSLPLLYIGAFVTVATFLLSVIFLYRNQRPENRDSKTFILFIDAPDPDNPAAAAAILKHVVRPLGSAHNRLHIVLTGRPLDLNIPKTGSKLLPNSAISRQDWEVSVPLHAQKVLEDSACRLTVYLKNCGINVDKEVTIYDGGVAPTAPLSDVVHDWDFLFDRTDLITNNDNDCGQILTPKDYTHLVDHYSSLSASDRVDQLLSILRPYPLTPLSVLSNNLRADSCKEVVIFLGGPATAIVKLFKHSGLSHKVMSLYGMFGSLSPGETTLLNNQFNVACDIDRACELFIDNLFPNADKRLITTETTKNSILLLGSKDIMDMKVPSYFCQLHKLWEHTHNDRVQPLFDVVPVLAYMKRYRGCFTWRRMKAVLYEWQKRNKRNDKDSNGSEVQQQFVFIDSDKMKHSLVSDEAIGNFNNTEFVKFMTETWT